MGIREAGGFRCGRRRESSRGLRRGRPPQPRRRRHLNQTFRRLATGRERKSLRWRAREGKIPGHGCGFSPPKGMIRPPGGLTAKRNGVGGRLDAPLYLMPATRDRAKGDSRANEVSYWPSFIC